MKNFTVTIEETCAQEFQVAAQSAAEARELARKMYRSGELVLEPGEVQLRRMSVQGGQADEMEWEKF